MPGSLSTPIRPPIISTSFDEIARPSPVPPNRRVVEPSTCSNGSKTALQLVGGDADPGVGDIESEDDLVKAGVFHRHIDDDLAAVGELDGVADQVDQDLAQAIVVADQRVRNIGGDPASQLEALGVRTHRQRFERSLDGVAQARTVPDRSRACPPRSWRNRGCR